MQFASILLQGLLGHLPLQARIVRESSVGLSNCASYNQRKL